MQALPNMGSQAKFDIRWVLADEIWCQLYCPCQCFAALQSEMRCEPHGLPPLTHFTSMSFSDLALPKGRQKRANVQHVIPKPSQGAYQLRHGTEKASKHCKRLGEMWDEEHVNGSRQGLAHKRRSCIHTHAKSPDAGTHNLQVAPGGDATSKSYLLQPKQQ